MTSYVSFLSDKVKAILECAGTDQDIHEGLPLYTHNEQGLPIFNLNLIRKDLDSLPASRDHEFYLQMSKYFSQIFHCCQKSIGSLDPSKLDFDGFTWISSRRFFRDVVVGFVSGSVSPYETVLYLSSILERSLGNVVSTLCPKSSVPPLTKDLIVHRNLKSLWQDETLDEILHFMMGTPQGLNLRNLLWHGFLNLREVTSSIAAGWIVLIFTLNYFLKHLKIIPRPFFSLTRIDKVVNALSKTFHFDKFSKENPNRSPSRWSLENFEQSKVAIDKIELGYKLFDNEEYARCLCILMPELECFCRVIFTEVNGCHSRLLTAESDTLYTTFEDILSRFFPQNGDKDNAFLSYVGPCIAELLFDLLIYPDGPRLRDKLSHGEVDYEDEASCYLRSCSVVVMLGIVHISDILSGCGSSPKRDFELSYRSVFHPLAQLLNELETLFFSVENFQPYLKSNFEDSIVSAGGEPSIFEDAIYIRIRDPLLFPEETTPSKMIEDTRAFCKNSSLGTLFKSRSEYSLISIHRKIVSTLVSTMERISTNLKDQESLFQQHKLRSRQRATFFRMRTTLPAIFECCRFIGFFISQEFLSLQRTGFLRDLKFLQKILKETEKLSENVSSQKNRWVESRSLLLNLKMLFKTEGFFEEKTTSVSLMSYKDSIAVVI